MKRGNKKTPPVSDTFRARPDSLPLKMVSSDSQYCKKGYGYLVADSKVIRINSLNSCNALAWLNTQEYKMFFTKKGLANAIGVSPYQARKILYELKERGLIKYTYHPDRKVYQLRGVMRVFVDNYCPYEFDTSCESCPLDRKPKTEEERNDSQST